MIFEFIITLEIIAFILFGLGIIPSKGDPLTGKVPLLNKIIFVLSAAIIFFMLGLTSVVYDYNYCYVNQTVSDFTNNMTTSTATCNNYQIENFGLSFFNNFMGFFCIALFIILTLFAIASRHDDDPGMGDYSA